MNRAVCLHRPEPREADLQATGLAIVRTEPSALSAPSAAAVGPSGGAAGTPGGGNKGDLDDLGAPPPPPVLRRASSLPLAHLAALLAPLAAAYHSVYCQQRDIGGGRDFIGVTGADPPPRTPRATSRH